MIDWLQGFVVGASLAAAPMAFAVGMGKGHERSMQSVKALPSALGEAVAAVKNVVTGVKKNEPGYIPGNGKPASAGGTAKGGAQDGALGNPGGPGGFGDNVVPLHRPEGD